MIRTSKNVLLAVIAIVLCNSFATTYGMVVPIRFPDGKDGYGFRPEFNLTLCGVKITASGAFATVLAGLGLYFLKKGVTAWIERNDSWGPDNQKKAAEGMVEKAKHYGIAAAICIAPSMFIIGKNIISAAFRSARGTSATR